MNVAHSGVGLHVRWQLLSAWVQCKQLLQQPVPRDTLGHENQVRERTTCGCIFFVIWPALIPRLTHTLVIAELLWLQK